MEAVLRDRIPPDLAWSFNDYALCCHIFHCTPEELDRQEYRRSMECLTWHVAVKKKEVAEMEKEQRGVGNKSRNRRP